MDSMHSLQALYGGTFDPVHYGHLKPVEILANLIGLQQGLACDDKLRSEERRVGEESLRLCRSRGSPDH